MGNLYFIEQNIQDVFKCNLSKNESFFAYFIINLHLNRTCVLFNVSVLTFAIFQIIYNLVDYVK